MYGIIVGAFLALVIAMGIAMNAGSGFAKPGYIPPAATNVKSASGQCYDFEANCQNYTKPAPGSSYYSNGQYLSGNSYP